MAFLPAGVVFVNNDLTPSVERALVRQLYITEVIDGYVFDDRIAANPNYIETIKLLNIRIMVVRSYKELESRELADVAIFVSHGLASVLKNNFGPPILSQEVSRLTWNKLCVF